MKKYLKNNEGMALPMVLIIMAILMTFATSLALFAYDSLLSVRWMGNEKRAYYLARAGIEAASYAYQVAATDSTSYNDSTDVNGLSDISQVVIAARDGALNADGSAPVKSNTIYAYYTAPNGGNGPYNGIRFEQSGDTDSPDCLGSFVVEIGKGIDLRQFRENKNQNFTQDSDDVVAFKCTARCGRAGDARTRVMYAYITETAGADKVKLYGDDGTFKPENFTKEPEIEIDLNTGKTNYATDNKGFIGFFKNINNFFKGVMKDIMIRILGSTKKVQPYSFSHGGSVVLTAPAKSKTIKAPTSSSDSVRDHLYIIQTAKNLFINAGLDATSEKQGFTTFGLYGDQIVVDGDITMDVYITDPDSILGNSHLGGIAAQRNFRIGTVIIGCATSSGTCSDPLGASEGGLQVNGEKIEKVNKIFFNGNVVLKVYTQGAATQTFRVFNAGDVAYFDGCNVTATRSETETGEATGGSKGIDLLRFFIDASLADLDGFEQNERTKNKLRQILKNYYTSDGKDYEPYVTEDGKTILMRKIIVRETNNTYLVDGSTNNIKEIIQPSEGAGAEIVWGRPRHGDVWNNFEKVS